MNLQLKDEVVVVTGGSGSLGRQIVQLFVDVGAHCVIPLRDNSELQSFPLTDHEQVDFIRGIDLADERQTEHFYEEVVELKGVPWATVNLAGGFGMGPIEKTTLEDLQHQIQINLYTCFSSTRSAVQIMREYEQGGRIVNVASRPGIEAEKGANLSAYTSSKAAVAALTRSLASELVEEDILVNAVAPSIIDTDPNRRAMPDADPEKWVKPVDLGQQILFLASPVNRSTRGAVIPVYGKS